MEVDSVKRFFNEEEWNSFSFYEKKRFANMQKNYDHLQSIGIKASIPQFMLRKKREETPTCSKYADKEVKSVTATKNRSDVGKEDSEDSDLEELKEFEKSNLRTDGNQFNSDIHLEELEEIDCSKQKSALGKSSRNMISFLIKATKKNLDCLEKLLSPLGSKRCDIKKNASNQLQRRYPKRNVRKVCYTEEEISSEDDYFYCDVCNREFKSGACPKHGPFLHVADRQVPPGSSPTRAQETSPRFFSVCRSSIKGAGLGIWTELDLPMGLNFGPYEGTVIQTKKEAQQSGYAWEIRRRGKVSHYIQGSDNSISNWMRFVNCAPTEDRQNLMAYQFRGNIFYRTYKSVMAYTELLVWYGDEFGSDLGLCLSEGSEHKLGKYILPDVQNSSSHSREVFQKVSCLRVCNRQPIPSRISRNRNVSSKFNPSGRHRMELNEIGPKRDSPNVSKVKKVFEALGCVASKCLEDDKKKPQSISVGEYAEVSPGDLSQIKQVHPGDVVGASARSEEDVAEDDNSMDSAGDSRNLQRETNGNRNVRKSYPCDDCDFSASIPSRLKVHVEGVHLKRRPYRCRECDYRAQKASHLREHTDAVHLRKGSHNCPHCHYGTARASSLRRHLEAVHLKKRPHKCHLCEYETAHPSRLKEHINAVHLKKKPYKCPHCDHETANLSNLQTHVKMVHLKIRPFMCKHCPYEAGTFSNLQRHLKKIHLKTNSSLTSRL